MYKENQGNIDTLNERYVIAQHIYDIEFSECFNKYSDIEDENKKNKLISDCKIIAISSFRRNMKESADYVKQFYEDIDNDIILKFLDSFIISAEKESISTLPDPLKTDNMGK